MEAIRWDSVGVPNDSLLVVANVEPSKRIESRKVVGFFFYIRAHFFVCFITFNHLINTDIECLVLKLDEMPIYLDNCMIVRCYSKQNYYERHCYLDYYY